MRPVAIFVIEILTLHKGLVQATPSTRTLELRVADITISSVPTQHAQHKVAAKFEVSRDEFSKLFTRVDNKRTSDST